VCDTQPPRFGNCNPCIITCWLGGLNTVVLVWSVQVAIVRAASMPDQATWHADLGTIVKAIEKAGALSPCVMIIGRVASSHF